MSKRRITCFLLLVLIVLLVVSCRQDESTTETATDTPDQAATAAGTIPATETTATATATPPLGRATVESIQIMILESFPVQVNALVRGEISNNCTVIDGISAEMAEDQFEIKLAVKKQDTLPCTETAVPFEESVSLDVLGLDAGRYIVAADGITGSFTLDVDNRLPPESTTEPTSSSDPRTASISGSVWHDLCSVVPGEGEIEPQPSAGCVETADGGWRANGTLEELEPGLPGILITLSEGACPGQQLQSVNSDEDGGYLFQELAAGLYCVSADALGEQNSAILIPGEWTYPVGANGTAEIALTSGEAAEAVNFGWDFQFRPIPDIDLTSCRNSIGFVKDLSIPDDTIILPGAEFSKGWQLRNTGTCPWTTDYGLTFVGGDGIPGARDVPLEADVAPGETVDLYVTLSGPENSGTYRDNWQLRDANGEPFGIDGDIREAFWLQIVVAEPAATPVPNSAAIGGVIWADSCRLLSGGSPSAGCIEAGEGSGVYVADGSLNFAEAPIADIVVLLGQGVCPAEGPILETDILATATSGQDGLYRFANLDEGSYCIAIEAFSPENVETLIPGDWTWPARGVGRLTVVLTAGEEILDVDFGWDYLD